MKLDTHAIDANLYMIIIYLCDTKGMIAGKILDYFDTRPPVNCTVVGGEALSDESERDTVDNEVIDRLYMHT